MANWYCDFTSGDDSTGDGSSGTPYKTLQKVVDNATGGDTLNIANTSAQVLTAPITWNTGFTADNTKYTILQAWDNGGAITTQRPDEAVARVGATIDGNNSITESFSPTSAPQRIVFKNIKFEKFTLHLVRAGAIYIFDGVEFDCSSVGNNQAIRVESNLQDLIINSYAHSYDGTSNAFSYSQGKMYNNYIIGSTSNGYGLVRLNNNNTFSNNIIINTGSGAFFGTSGINIIANNNTLIANSTANSVGLFLNASSSHQIFNNLFYKFDGTGAKAISLNGSQTQQLSGNNAYFDSNLGDSFASLAIDLTANDITGTGDPFVDSTNDDYTLKSDSLARGAGLSNPNSSLDIGAVQSASSGGGGGAVSAPIMIGD